MTTPRVTFIAIAVFTSSASASAQFPNPFVVPKAPPVPFSERREHDIWCPSIGGGSSAAKRASNKAKNQLSTSASVASIPLKFADFAALQKFVDDRPGLFPRDAGGAEDGYSLPADRTRLKNVITVTPPGFPSTKIGEGDRVMLVAYVIGARHSNTEDGESVNCGRLGLGNNDIHIELAETPSLLGDKTKRVTAEIIPHLRPLVWERFDTDPTTGPLVAEIEDIDGDIRPGKPGITELKGKKVRIYGHLYFDDVHRPCFKKETENPSLPCSRLSTWEIHPVYLIDVEENGEWVPFHEWAARR